MLKTLNLICEKYSLDKYELNLFLESNNVKVPSEFCILPWTNDIKSNICCGLKYNNGLFTQCDKSLHTTKYCKTCNKQAEKNETGKPDAGDVEDRLKVGVLDYIDAKGRKAVPFTDYMKNNNISKEVLLRVANNYNIKIPEEQFKEPLQVSVVKKRGRPKKTLAISNNDVDISINSTKDNEEYGEMKQESYVDVDRENYDEEMNVCEIIVNNIKYYKDEKTNNLYDNSGSLIGRWDSKLNIASMIERK